jgi:NAD(P)-dependent dehydrogenase (short-subunit alcohol dehydrogenase family)
VRPVEIAPLIAFLASVRNSYISGITIAIDGGATRGA